MTLFLDLNYVGRKRRSLGADEMVVQVLNVFDLHSVSRRLNPTVQGTKKGAKTSQMRGHRSV